MNVRTEKKMIRVDRITEQQKKALQIPEIPCQQGKWAVWECAPLAFDWHYDQMEKAYIYEGRAVIRSAKQEITISAGDFVVFPVGLDCRWEVFETVRKVYLFE